MLVLLHLVLRAGLVSVPSHRKEMPAGPARCSASVTWMPHEANVCPVLSLYAIAISLASQTLQFRKLLAQKSHAQCLIGMFYEPVVAVLPLVLGGWVFEKFLSYTGCTDNWCRARGRELLGLGPTWYYDATIAKHVREN